MKKTIINILLLLAAVLGFGLAHPTDFYTNGLPFLSYLAFIPVFLLVQRNSFKTVWLYGFAYGILGYCVLVAWLGKFNPAAMPVIALMYGLYLMVTFPLMKIADLAFPKYRGYAQWVVWCAYEFVKTLGFSGFHYGVTAYSHWKFLPFIQSASLVGVFGLSAFITFFSAIVTQIINDDEKVWYKKILNHKIALIVWILIYAFILVYGFVSPVDYSDCETKTIAVLQTNSDPWVGGDASIKRDLATTMRLSDEALAENPNIDFVVWPETAFVPRIEWHYTKRENRVSYLFVKALLEYLDTKEVPFIIGGDDGTYGYNIDGTYEQIDYNSVLLFKPGENVIPPNPEKYHKNHLVPFTEHFPFKKQLPLVYKMLEENDTHFWVPGKEMKVFNVDGFSFSTPICFEDTFGSISRQFVNNGARAIINLSNDAWAHSESCQLQHLSMAVFRSVENHIPTVRSTASGATVIIDANGKVQQMLPFFTEGYLIGEIPVIENLQKTVYTRFGDYVGYIFVILSVCIFAYFIVTKIIKLTKKES